MMKTKDSIHRKVLDLVLPIRRCSVEIAPGVGKTRIVLKHADILFKRITSIQDPSTFKILICTSRKKAIQGYIKEIKELNLQYLLDHIEFVLWISLDKAIGKYYIAYLDEIHNMKKSHVSWLSSHSGGIFGLTGTMPRKSDSRYQRIQFYCPTIYTYLIEDAVNEQVINDYKITIHLLSLDSNKVVKKQTKNGRIWYISEVEAYKYWTDKLEFLMDPNEEDNSKSLTNQEREKLSILRMKTLQSLPSKLSYAKQLINSYKEKTIIFVNTKSQADECCTHSFHSSNSKSEYNLELFCSSEITKLSCVAQLSESVNIPNLQRGIITHTFGNTINATQRIARMLRLIVGEIAEIDILCYKDTIDTEWVKSALQKFDQSKITWYDTENF